MASTVDFIEFVCEQIHGTGEISSRKMFGEYMVYVNGKPILLVCDNTVFVKKLDCLSDVLKEAATGFPYVGSKEHYVLDVDDSSLSKKVIAILEPITALPKKKKKKEKVEEKERENFPNN